MRGHKTKELWANPEYRKKMSEAHKGIKMPPFTEEHKEKIRKTMTGRKYSDERKANISKGKKGKPMPSQLGEKNRFWKGGRTSLRQQINNNFKYRLWRSDVYTRDDFTCVICSQRGGKIEADHIKSVSSILDQHSITTIDEAIACEELWNVNNGRTLCRLCHQKTPTYGGNSRKKI